MSLVQSLKSVTRVAAIPGRLALTQARSLAGRPPRFSGAWPDRAAALASLPPQAVQGYDNDGVADVSFEQMARVATWDYPVLFWLQALLGEGGRVLDAGGHMGTKYIAFEGLLPLEAMEWTVLDLPAIICAARMAQEAGRLPAAIRFIEDISAAPEADILLASGLLQYLDISLTEFLERLPQAPRHLLLNKVAMREGPQVVTLERIGAARVPYCIRSRAAFTAEVDALGYRVRDSWEIEALSNTIPTHPWLGQSTSRGILLEKITDSQ